MMKIVSEIKPFRLVNVLFFTNNKPVIELKNKYNSVLLDEIKNSLKYSLESINNFDIDVNTFAYEKEHRLMLNELVDNTKENVKIIKEKYSNIVVLKSKWTKNYRLMIQFKYK